MVVPGVWPASAAAHGADIDEEPERLRLVLLSPLQI